MVVTFSGGGKRAAAFSFGVLEALRDMKVTTPDGEQHPLLDEIDLISAVSGGAFTAAYYALHGKEAFESYAPRFLNHDTEKDLWHKVLAPANWPRLAKTLVSRSDLEVEYFDEELFNGATVYDVMTRSPRVIISATDLVRAKPFAFTREQLNGICVDPEERAGGARGVRIRGHADLFRAAGHAQLRRAMRLPAAGQRQPRRDRAMKTSIAASAPSACCRSSTPTTTPTCIWPTARWPTTSARARFSTRWRSAKRSPTRCAAMAFRARAACCSSWSTRAPGFDRRYAQRPEPLGIKKVMDAVVSATFNRYSFETMNLHARAREALGDRSAQHALQGRRWRSPTATSSTSTSWS